MSSSKSFERLVTIMDELREKCPWDKKQTIHTLRQMTLEETYELADAITESDWNSIREELGDLMLHLVFYSKIGTEQNKFTLEDVIEGVCKKLIDFENLLTESGFCRVHHSSLINLKHILKYIKGEGGYVILTDNYHVDISRRKKEEFLQLLDRL